MRTRSIFARVFALHLAAAALFSTTAQSASIQLVPSSVHVAVGESLSVDIVAHDLPVGDGLVGFGFDIAITPESIATPAALTLTPDLTEPFTDLGTLTEVVALAGLEAISGITRAVLATLELTALARGMLALVVTADPATNPDHGLALLSGALPEDFDDAALTLSVTAAPLPGTAALLALGLLALARRSAR
jgi:hypothetical protein